MQQCSARPDLDSDGPRRSEELNANCRTTFSLVPSPRPPDSIKGVNEISRLFSQYLGLVEEPSHNFSPVSCFNNLLQAQGEFSENYREISLTALTAIIAPGLAAVFTANCLLIPN